MTTREIKKFQNKILKFYSVNKRIFPWRDISDPYKIMVSEFMLQQTQVLRVLPKYENFLLHFPTIDSLSHASNESVLKLWNGLGYNRRAIYLKNAAIHLCSNPEISVENLKTIKGIGVNTAAAIFVFSMNKPHVFIETNIRRVFIHEFFQNKKTVDDKEILKLVSETSDLENPRDWFYALMDYGAYISKIEVNPNRKSKHYTKQSKFHGSVRQTRGKIIKILLDEKRASIKYLQEKVNSPHFKTALTQLESENFISVKNNAITIF